MATSFLSSLSGKLAERWVTSLLTPAFIFWIGGLLAWLSQDEGWQELLWRTNALISLVLSLDDPWKIALAIASLLLITISALVIERFDLLVIRFLEGYWPTWLYPLWKWCVGQQRHRFRRYQWQFKCLAKKREDGLSEAELKRYRASYYPWFLQPVRMVVEAVSDRTHTHQQRKKNRLEQRRQAFLSQRAQGGGEVTALSADEYEELAQIEWQLHNIDLCLQGLTPKEELEYALLDWKLKQFPGINRLMPTHFGNILRVAETRPGDKYGLDAILCWSHLWFVLPEEVKQEIQSVRSELNIGARTWLWSLLFTLWGFWSVWAIGVGLLAAFLCYRWMISTGMVYADLIEAAFDLHRTELYTALRLPLPDNPKDERHKGAEMTTYLLGGCKQDKPEFTKITKDS